MPPQHNKNEVSSTLSSAIPASIEVILKMGGRVIKVYITMMRWVNIIFSPVWYPEKSIVSIISGGFAVKNAWAFLFEPEESLHGPRLKDIIQNEYRIKYRYRI